MPEAVPPSTLAVPLRPINSVSSTFSATIAPLTSNELSNNLFLNGLIGSVKERFKRDPYFKWVLIGGSVYVIAHFTPLHRFVFWPVQKLVEFCGQYVCIPKSILIWTGEVEPEIPLGRLGYTRCLESDYDVMEKFGIPMNSEKCLRDGFMFLPGEFYPLFDLNQYDPKETPLVWTYGPIKDPGLIQPIGWFNDMSGEHQDFELFCKYLRVFGYLPPDAYLELFRHCKLKLLRSRQYLIKVGDADDKVFIIINGAVEVYSNRIGLNREYIRLRTATYGGQISSLFSIVDALSGYARNIFSINAVSILDTTKVLVFPVAALKDYLIRNKKYLVSSIVHLLERGYRFQYQILHLAMQLTNQVSILDPEPLLAPLRKDVQISPDQNDEDILSENQDKAIQGFMEFLEIDDFDFLKENCQIFIFEAHEPSNDLDEIKNWMENSPETAYKYVHAGKLEQFHLKSNLSPMDQNSRKKPEEEAIIPETLTNVTSGQGVGGLTGILGYFNILFYRCVERAIVVTLNADGLRRLLDEKPLVIFPISYMVLVRMTPFIRAIDFAMEWTMANEGQYIFHKEQMCEDSYLILRGRARAYHLDSVFHQKAILEYRENDWIGVIESLLQSKRRSKTCVVIRQTEFVKIPNDLLRNIVLNYSSAAQIMLKFLVKRSLKSKKAYYDYDIYDTIRRQHEMNNIDLQVDIDHYRESRRIHSIALVPVSENLPYSVLALEMKKHYESAGTCFIATYRKTMEALSLSEITINDKFSLEMYILAKLKKYELVIFICLPRIHYWNEVSSNHSEAMFTVGCSSIPNIRTEPPDFEEEIVGKRISSRRKELIILHRMETVLPRNTKEWLYCRDWIDFHHHIRLPNEAFNFLGAISEETLMMQYGGVLYRKFQMNSDLARFLRWIQGKTFGILFSSGGARIGAQLGMLQALVEFQHIPIDMVVGTGSGFLLAALFAVYQDYKIVQKIIEQVFKDFKDLTNVKWEDVTFPYLNLVNGKRLLTYFYQMFGSIQIEDTWIPICCVTTNLTSQDVRVDRSGPLWVFVRASLSHINGSPPICDPIDGDYICNGTHANSLPQDIIKEYGAEYIMAFNTVGGKIDDSQIKADPNLSFTKFIYDSMLSFFKSVGTANSSFESVYNQLALTQTRMYASGVEAVSNLKFIVYVRPPVEHMASQNFNNLPALHRVGYFYMKAILDKNPYDPNVPFTLFWTKIKNTSKEMSKEFGRDVTSYITTY